MTVEELFGDRLAYLTKRATSKRSYLTTTTPKPMTAGRA